MSEKSSTNNDFDYNKCSSEIEKIIEKKLNNVIKNQTSELSLFKKSLKKELKAYKNDIKIETKNNKKIFSVEINDISENLNKSIDKFNQKFLEYSLNMENIRETDLNLMKKVAESIQKLNSKIESMNQIIDEKSTELRLYQEGYKFKIDKRNFIEIEKVINYINELQINNSKIDGDYIKRILTDDILSENGVHVIEINLGDEFDPAICKCVGIKPTYEKENDNKIAKITRNGYYIDLYIDKTKVLLSSEVEIYKYEKEKKEGSK